MYTLTSLGFIVYCSRDTLKQRKFSDFKKSLTMTSKRTKNVLLTRPFHFWVFSGSLERRRKGLVTKDDSYKENFGPIERDNVKVFYHTLIKNSSGSWPQVRVRRVRLTGRSQQHLGLDPVLRVVYVRETLRPFQIWNWLVWSLLNWSSSSHGSFSVCSDGFHIRRLTVVVTYNSP